MLRVQVCPAHMGTIMGTIMGSNILNSVYVKYWAQGDPQILKFQAY